TGDESVLDVAVPFLEGPQLEEEEAESFFVPVGSAEDGSLLEHCRRAILKGHSTGPHGLPLIQGGDWNDGLNRVGADGKGESVWLAWFLITVMEDFARLLDRRGEREEAAGLRK